MCNLSNFPDLDISQEAGFQLELMLSAIKNVKSGYLWYKYYSDKEKKKVKEHLERVFAYEFYHQWRMILDVFGIHLYINGEISKEIKDKMKNNHVKNLFPDLILHGGQDCHDAKKQLIACEIKRKEKISGKKVKEDIESLINYLSKEYFTKTPFQCGVFILVGETLENTLETKKILNKIREIYNLNHFSAKILCISYDFRDEHCILQYKSLKTILDKSL